MTRTSDLPHQPIPATIDHALQSADDIIGLLNRDEIPLLLASIKQSVQAQLQTFEGFEKREIELLGEISTGSNYERLRSIHDELNVLHMERFLDIPSVPAVHRSCTRYRDHLANKAVELVLSEMEEQGLHAPVPFALISMGSDGREEQTLITDQDYLIVYGDEGGAEADDYFEKMSFLLVDRLEQIGFKKCTGDMMPSNPTWRGSYSQWNKRLLAIVRYEYTDYAKNLMDLIVLSDARYVAGDNGLADRLIRLIRSLEADYFQVLWGMAKAATEMRLALGFLKRLWTEGSGEHRGEFNIKLLAWAPLIMNVRILSINLGIPASNTLERIELLVKEKSLSRPIANGLTDAYHILTKHRILLQIRVIKGIQKDSYYLNPYTLPAEEREMIRQAMLRIEELQKMIHINFSIM